MPLLLSRIIPVGRRRDGGEICGVEDPSSFRSRRSQNVTDAARLRGSLFLLRSFIVSIAPCIRSNSKLSILYSLNRFQIYFCGFSLLLFRQVQDILTLSLTCSSSTCVLETIIRRRNPSECYYSACVKYMFRNRLAFKPAFVRQT